MRWLILLTLALTACGEKVTPEVKPGETFYLPPVEWRVVNEAQMVKAYGDAGKAIPPGHKLEGFIGHHTDGTVIVYTLPPKTVNDTATCTLGHEIMHEALGDYHR